MIQKNFNTVIGVDIAKKKFDAAFLLEGKFKHKVFTNNTVGFADFVAWFSTLCGDTSPLICMEATGSYSLPLADYLVNHGFSVSLVNPAKIHAFAKSELSRAKTDKADAKLIARYARRSRRCGCHHPPIFVSYKHCCAALNIY